MTANERTASKYKKIDLGNGASISYTDEGKGKKTILFIHGLATSGGTWLPNTIPLSEQYRCMAIDLPGNGLSEKKDYPFSIDFYAQCVYGFIVEMGLKNLTICGHSMGGQIALRLLQQKPEVAEKLILCAPAGFERFSYFEKTMYQSSIGLMNMLSTDEGNIRNSIHSSFYTNPRQADAIVNELVAGIKNYPPNLYKKMMDSSITAMMTESVYEKLNEIQQPTLVIFGDSDALIPNKLIHPTSTEQLAKQAIAQMPNAELKMIPRAGHFVQWEKAAEVNDLITAFMNK